MPTTQEQKAADFRALHEGETFIIPNPWDVGSARVMQALGFKALATTSGGFAFTLGRLDGNVTLDDIADHTRALAEGTDLPVSVDLENGYGPNPEDAATAITRAAEAGAVGGSIEDFDPRGELYEFDHAVERIAAAVEAARSLDFPFTLTARAENYFRGNPDLDDTIARLAAYERAGADVLYAPGLTSADDIRALCDAVSKPVNVLGLPGLTVAEIAEAGAKRISVGSLLDVGRGGRDGDRVAAAARHRRPVGAGSARTHQGVARRLMPRYAAFLRGVNLGSRRKAGSAQLRSCLEAAGLDEVQTFRTSGNVVFDAGRESRARLTERIEQALAECLGFDVDVFLRTAQELSAIAEHKPFPAKVVEASKGKLQVSMLSAKPTAATRKRVLALATKEDRLSLSDRELYWLPSGGIRDSALNAKALEELVGSSTMRTKGNHRTAGGEIFRLKAARDCALPHPARPGCADRRAAAVSPPAAQEPNPLEGVGFYVDRTRRPGASGRPITARRRDAQGRPDPEDRPRAEGALAGALHAAELRRQGAPADRPRQGARRGPDLHRAARGGDRLRTELPGRRPGRGRADARTGTTTSHG